MKPLNRQQRKAAIWRFIIIYLITLVLIVIPFVFTGAFKDAQKEQLDKFKSTSKECIDCQKNLEEKNNDYKELNSKYMACRSDNQKLQEQIDNENAGINTSRSEQVSTSGSGTEFAQLIKRYESVSKRMNKYVGNIYTAKGRNRSQLTEANYGVIGENLDSLKQVQKDLSRITSDLKDIAK
jgi:septal ring factor EnvC (AmiA/AmiB activator)